MELLECALKGVFAVIGSNTVALDEVILSIKNYTDIFFVSPRKPGPSCSKLTIIN